MKALYTLILVFFGAAGALFAWVTIVQLSRGNSKEALFPAIFVAWMWILAGGAWFRIRKDGRSKMPIQSATDQRP
jgi:hypothetical protein